MSVKEYLRGLRIGAQCTHFAWKISNNCPLAAGGVSPTQLEICEKSQIRKDNDNRPSTAMNFEISVDIGSVYRQG